MLFQSPASTVLPSVARRQERRGVTVVEFALAFPIVITIVIGMIEFSRMNNLRHAADNAAYEAARFVIVPGASAEEARTAALDLLARTGVSDAIITVTPNVIAEDTARVEVHVDVPLIENSWLPPVMTRNSHIQRSCTLVTERVPVIQLEGIPGSSSSSSSSSRSSAAKPASGSW